MDEREPCPFCGCEIIDVESARAPDEGYTAVCTLCNACGPLCESMAAAVQTWNERE